MPIFIVPNDLIVVAFLPASIDLFFLVIYFSVLLTGREHPKLSDKELIAKCTQKSADWQNFWREFQNRFGKKILFYIYGEFHKISGEKSLTEFHEIIKDLRQDVYIKLLKNDSQALKNFNGKNETSFLAYLHVIAKNVVVNYVNTISYQKSVSISKIKHRSDSEDSEMFPFQPVSMDTVDELEKSIFKNFILEKIKTCFHSKNFERDILLFKLFYFKGFTSREIAKDTNFKLSASGIETVVNRIVQRLRENLKK